MSNQDSIAAKIRALLAKTVENGASEAEAMMAMAKASQLMTKYGLSITDVELRAEKCVTNSINSGQKNRGGMARIAVRLAQFCNCKVWSEQRRDENGKIVSYHQFFGLESDTQIAQYFYDMIKAVMEAETARFKKTAIYDDAQYHSGGRRRATASFISGFARRINERLQDMIDERDGEYRSTGSDLIVVKNQIVTEEFAKLKLRLTSASSSRTRLNGEAYGAGKAAGERVGFNAGVGASRGSVAGYIR